MKPLAVRLAVLLALAGVAHLHYLYFDPARPVLLIPYGILMAVIVAYAGYVLWRIWKRT